MEFRSRVHGSMATVPDIEFNYGSVYIRFNVTRVQETFRFPDDNDNIIEQTIEVWEYDEWFMSDYEYKQVQQGYMPYNGRWDEQTHKIFREYQHERADDKYTYAERMFRATGDSRYSAYISQLDQWNAAISATKTTLSLDIPVMPTID